MEVADKVYLSPSLSFPVRRHPLLHNNEPCFLLMAAIGEREKEKKKRWTTNGEKVMRFISCSLWFASFESTGHVVCWCKGDSEGFLFVFLRTRARKASFLTVSVAMNLQCVLRRRWWKSLSISFSSYESVRSVACACTNLCF